MSVVDTPADAGARARPPADTLGAPTDRPAPRLGGPGRAPARGHALVLGFYALLSVAWTWPWAAYDGDALPLRQFDLFGVLWVIRHATDLLVDLRSTESGLPLGENVSRLDTWVLAAIGVALRWMDPVRVAQGVVLLGPVVSAFAAERCAATLDVPRPWSVLAGVVYGFCGLGATAQLEGHVYLLLVPWPPLMLRSLLLATGAAGTARHGLAAGAWWALALLTSGYVGVVATAIAIAIGARSWFVRLDRRRLLAPAAAFAAVAASVGLPYVHLFARGEGGVAKDASMVSMAGSASLATLATWSPDVDISNHSIAAPLGFATVALVVAAPVVLRRRRGWRTLLAVALLGVAASLGPAVQSGMGGHGTWYLFDPAHPPPGLAFLHFPVRMLWLWYLGAGLVAAQVAAALADRRGAAGLLALVVADAFVTSGVPLRQGMLDASLPAAYLAAPPEHPVLDLLAEDADAGSGVNLRVRRMACWYQLLHERPVAERCLTPHGAPAQETLERGLRAALLDGTDPRAALAGSGIDAVAVHVDLFRPEDRVRVLAGMTDAFGPPVGGDPPEVALGEGARDSGEAVVLFRVDGPAPGADVADDVAADSADR